MAGDPSCAGVRFLLFWNILQDRTKKLHDVQEVVLDISAGQRTDCGVPVHRKGFKMN